MIFVGVGDATVEVSGLSVCNKLHCSTTPTACTATNKRTTFENRIVKAKNVRYNGLTPDPLSSEPGLRLLSKEKGFLTGRTSCVHKRYKCALQSLRRAQHKKILFDNNRQPNAGVVMRGSWCWCAMCGSCCWCWCCGDADHTQTHVHLHVHVHVQIYIYKIICTFRSIYTHMKRHLHLNQHVHLHIQMHMHLLVQIQIHMRIHGQVLMHTHTKRHAHLHIHTQKNIHMFMQTFQHMSSTSTSLHLCCLKLPRVSHALFI